MICEVEITRMGREGEGIAAINGKPVYVPFTLPQEVAEISLQPGGQGNKACSREIADFPDKNMRGKILKLKHKSPERQEPLCRYFGACGGCLLQHWRQEPYQAWKRSLPAQALAQAGLAAADIESRIAPLFLAKAGTRRRLIMSASCASGQVALGFNRTRSHDIIPLEECPVAEPALVAVLPFIRRLLTFLRPRRQSFHIVLTQLDNGLDIALQGLPDLAEAEKLRLADFIAQKRDSAEAAKILRLTADKEIILETTKPFLHFGAVKVEVPSGGFLQAARGAEEHMGALVAQALRKCKNVADLFAGCGSFTFRLAAQSNVHAVEQDKAALAALGQAAADAAAIQAASGGKSGLTLKKITYERRDLFQQPLTARELAAYDGLVFDPPRAGAERQAQEIAKAQLKTVAAVSCNPASLARDISILLQGGYELQSVAPIDQFLWSPHVETVAILTKRSPKKSWKF